MHSTIHVKVLLRCVLEDKTFISLGFLVTLVNHTFQNENEDFPDPQMKKYTGVQFPPVSDDQLGKMILIDVYTNVNADIKNIPYKEQVYFDNVIAKALYDYSFQWDGPMNWYLRQGEEYFNSSTYKTFSFRYGDPNFKTDRQSMEIIIKGYSFFIRFWF